MCCDQGRLEHHVPQSATTTGNGPFPAKCSAVMRNRGQSSECGSLFTGDGAAFVATLVVLYGFAARLPTWDAGLYPFVFQRLNPRSCFPVPDSMLIHSNISFTLLLRIERPCRLCGWGEQSSTKSKTGLSEKQFRRLKARQRLICRCVRSLTPRRRGAGCRRFEHRSSSVHLRMLQTWLYPPAFI